MEYKQLYNYLITNSTDDLNNTLIFDKLEENKNKINTIINSTVLHDMPNQLKMIYHIIGNKQLEIHFKYWTLLSLSSLLKKKSSFFNNNIRIIDFSIIYCGSGIYIVGSYDTKDGMIFYRQIGGKNSAERMLTYNFVNNYNPDNGKKYQFSHWINETKKIYKGGISNRLNEIPLAFSISNKKN